MADFEFDLDEGAVEDLADSAEMAELLQDIGDGIAELAASNAPKLSGAGAASIAAVVSGAGRDKHVDVSWSPEHFYMGFAETGTEHQAATPFLRPALDQTKI